MYGKRSIYFTDTEIEKLLIYLQEATNILGESEETCQSVDEDLNNGLGSALRKLYKGRNGERIYEKYKTKRDSY